MKTRLLLLVVFVLTVAALYTALRDTDEVEVRVTPSRQVGATPTPALR